MHSGRVLVFGGLEDWREVSWSGGGVLIRCGSILLRVFRAPGGGS